MARAGVKYACRVTILSSDRVTAYFDELLLIFIEDSEHLTILTRAIIAFLHVVRMGAKEISIAGVEFEVFNAVDFEPVDVDAPTLLC